MNRNGAIVLYKQAPKVINSASSLHRFSHPLKCLSQLLAPFIDLTDTGFFVEPNPALHRRIQHLPRPNGVEEPDHGGTCAFSDVTGVTGA